MTYPRTATVLGAALVSFLTAVATSAPAQAARPAPTVLHVGQVSEQDIPPQPGSEPDTLVEPDVAVSPLDPDVAVAAAHDGRFPNGGAVGISYSWTHDGGATWHHAPLPELTIATGGAYERASDPVVAFGPDGTVYLSTLVFNFSNCASAVAVSRSTDGGRTFGAPVLVHSTGPAECNLSDDKNWLVVDTGADSNHLGRLYQFWTLFMFSDLGQVTGSPQVLRWSDDGGLTWSSTVNVSATNIFTQDSQPMIKPDGTIVDTYLNFGSVAGGEGPERPGAGAAAQRQQRPRSRAAAAPAGDLVVARVSRDGGRTWSGENTVTHDAGEGPIGVRCCLMSGTADPVTGRMYVAWDSATPQEVRVSTSQDGRHWSPPILVNHDTRPILDHVNVDVSAYGGRVFVSYGTRDTTVENGRFVQQQLSTSYDAGAHFGREISVGPLSDLRYAAVAGGIFPGDYVGSAATHGRVYMVWCTSSAPADPAATFHQVVFGATLAP
jgi:hypothetical protein